MPIVRSSKFRHTVGAVAKREEWYPDLDLSHTSSDGNTVCASTTHIAFVNSSGHSIGVIPIADSNKRKDGHQPQTIGIGGSPLFDINFSPFRTSVLAGASDDGTIHITDIANTNAAFSLTGHFRRTERVEFHPVTDYVLASAAADKTVRLWDLAAETEKIKVEDFGDGVSDIAWNYDGSLLAATSKDKYLRLLDPRSGSATAKAEGHQGVKASRVTWVQRPHHLITTGFSKFRERQYAMWDARNMSKSLSGMVQLDASTGILVPLFDQDTKLLFLGGMGDTAVKVFECDDSKPFLHAITNVADSKPQKSLCLVPKAACNIWDLEVARVLKVTTDAIVPLSFTVPRKSKRDFAFDLFPPTRSANPALTPEEWWGGKNSDPELMALEKAIPPPNDVEFNVPFGGAAPPASSSSSSSAPVASTGAAASPAAEPEKEEPVYVPKVVKIVRSSQFRHINCKPERKEVCYHNVKVATFSQDASAIKSNGHLFGIPWPGTGGRLAVIPVTQDGMRLPNTPGVIETGSNVTDFDFSYFKKDLVAIGLEDAHTRLYQVPADLLSHKTNFSSPLLDLKGHYRKLTTVQFHPLASDLLLTTSSDLTARVWDLTSGQEALCLKDAFADVVQSVVWSWDAATTAFVTKDKLLHITDLRSAKVSAVSKELHSGTKGIRAAWVGKSNQIITVGFSKASEREISIWDLANLDKPLATQMVDAGMGVLTPYYDPDNSVAYLYGKGDGSILCYEIVNEAPYVHYLNRYTSSDPQVDLCVLPKTSCNVRDVEVLRFLKLQTDAVIPLAFRVPRTRMEFFQDDIFPSTWDVASPALSGADWLKGTTKQPPTMSLQPSDMKKLSDAPPIIREAKYKFDPNQVFEKETDSRETTITQLFDKMNTNKGDVLPQDLNEGVDEDEWSD